MGEGGRPSPREEARVLGEDARRGLSGHGFSTEGGEERRMSRSEFPRWGNERADESQTRALTGGTDGTGSPGFGGKRAASFAQ